MYAVLFLTEVQGFFVCDITHVGEIWGGLFVSSMIAKENPQPN